MYNAETISTRAHDRITVEVLSLGIGCSKKIWRMFCIDRCKGEILAFMPQSEGVPWICCKCATIADNCRIIGFNNDLFFFSISELLQVDSKFKCEALSSKRLSDTLNLHSTEFEGDCKTCSIWQKFVENHTSGHRPCNLWMPWDGPGAQGPHVWWPWNQNQSLILSGICTIPALPL